MRRFILLPLLMFALTAFTLGQTQVTFDHQTYAVSPRLNNQTTADFNNDGAKDFVTDGVDGQNLVLYVTMSNGDGTFQPTREIPLNIGVVDLATGDVDNDGNTDIIAVSGSAGIQVLYGKGDGTFSPPVLYATPGLSPNMAVVGDFTGDGKKDILITGLTDDDDFQDAILVNGGNRQLTFRAGQTLDTFSSCCEFNDIKVGDFDGDGHIDIVIQRFEDRSGPGGSTITMYYGDGAGHFTAGKAFDTADNVSTTVADLNQDGKSDLVCTNEFEEEDGSTSSSSINVFYGNAARTMTSTRLIDMNARGVFGVQVADFNGDGTEDLAFGSDGEYFLLQNHDGTFTLEKTGNPVASFIGDFDRNGKPDLASIGGSQLTELVNTTDSTDFSNNCKAPGHGISICSPAAGATVNGPVQFKVSAADFTPLRKLEVWMDGQKLQQSFYAFSTDVFLTMTKTLAAGSHTATIVATGFDHTQFSKNVTFTVGAATGCSAPSGGITVCSPTDGATVKAGTVRAEAFGVVGTSKMEVQVDGVHKSTVTGNKIDVTLTLGTKGKRRFDFFSLNSAGAHTAQKTVFITVQ